MSKRAIGNVKITCHKHSQYLLLYNYYITDEQLSSGLNWELGQSTSLDKMGHFFSPGHEGHWVKS